MIKKISAVVLALSLVMVSVQGFPVSEIEKAYAEETVSASIAIDINGSENRGNLKSPVFADWTLTGNANPSSFTLNDVSFKLSNSTGNNFAKSENKTLITGGNTPYLTTDGAYVNVDGADISLEISGLPAGTHTITTWHSYYKENKATYGEIGKLSISIDGVEKATVVPEVQVTDDLLAGIAYMEFDVTEGKTVTLTIHQAADSTGVDYPILNAFEIDGVHPTLSIKNVVPEQNDLHHDPELGLSWEGGDGAVSHDLYFGTDEYVISTATRASAEYKGNQTTTTYEFTEELSHMEDYYWRVDEIDANGTVVKGKVYHFQVRHLAFPTAEGYGRFAKAGRGGYVYEVTTLEDTGEEGSLRYGLETLKGARIIVFKVGGIIELKSTLYIPQDGGNVYVAGQTAPGDGITLIKQDFGGMGASDVVIRDVRVRVGDSNGQSTGGMGMASCDHSILDHCSIAWATDEGFSSRGAKNLTFQYNIIGESLHDSVHYNSDRTGTSPHAFAASISGNKGSFHHNLLINCTGRNWSLAGAVESDNKTYGGYLDISNNVIYNYTNRTTDGGVRRLNFVNNYYKKGASSRTMDIVSTDGDQLGTGDCQMMYVSGNMLVERNGDIILDSSDDAWAKGYAKAGSWGTEATVRSDEPFFENYITLESAEDAYETVLAKAGANYPKLDYIDSRYIKEASTGTYTYKGSKQGLLGIIDSQEDVGGYPTSSNFTGGEAPADSDHDGMPDSWETEHGLNPDNAADGSIISLSAEGYTNVEMYLNELMGDPLVWSDGKATNPTETPVVPTETVAPTESVKEELKGDVNLDGNVNATDALLVLKHAARISVLDEDACKRARLDDNESVDAADALIILKIAAKIL